MLHELIFVLSGFPSNVFVPHPAENPSTFAITPEFRLLHAAERESLNRLGQLGWYYAQLVEFCNQHERKKKAGAYAQSLVASLNSTLNEYRCDILSMEQRILNKDYDAGGGVVPTSLLTSSLGQWELLLPALLHFTRRLQLDTGLLLLDFVLDEAQTGHDAYRRVMEAMASRLYDVLYRQLTAWMVYGTMGEEFFVKKTITHVGWQRYALIKERIPTRLSMALAESILFVGKAVATVKDPPDAMKREHLKLLVALQHRQQPLDRVVQQLRKTTADWLFSTVLVKQHGLPRYFASFRNMFLLGYGALACNFIDACTQWRQRASLASKSVSTAEKIFRHQEFNALLAKASVGTEAEDALDGYGVKIVDHASGVLFSDLLLVDVPCILRYELQWPIDLFLSQSVIHQYSKLWSYLIGLKHVQVCLCESFLRTSQHAIWRLRSHMLYWVNALWSHVQANVIDVHYQNLMDTVSGTNAARDFEQLQMAHADYLQHVTRGCLLLSAECVQCIQQILRACLDFCQFVKQINETWRGAKRRKVEKTAAEIVREWTRGLEQKTAMATATDQVDTMEKDFIAMTSRFFDLLTHASPDIKASGNLDMLLMQLDYNKYYSGDRSMRVLLP